MLPHHLETAGRSTARAITAANRAAMAASFADETLKAQVAARLG